MPAIKPSSIRDLKERIGIYDVVSSSVALKKSGSNFKGLSPFTNEKTPSFYVSPDKALYKCFSTGKAGDIISFVMETERLNFAEAVESLAKQYSVELEYEAGGRPQEDRSIRQELFDIHDFVTAYYHECFLAKSESGKWIRDYWTENRKFDLSVAEDFKIGFAPSNGRELGHRIIKKGFSHESIDKSGLFYTRRGFQAETMGYRFRGRLMIPIRDHQGRVTAFTARQLEITPKDDPSREAKYVNSPETPIFHKGNLLFNLDRARMEVDDSHPFVMVEGQLDAIRCSSVGLKGAVAPQGTGITEQQLRLLKRYEPRLICLLDGDNAGQKAALRMLPLALAQGVETSFIPLDEGQDPDDLFRESGVDALDNLRSRETDAISFACQSLMGDGTKTSPEAKAKIARELFSIVKKTESLAAQKEYVKSISQHLDVDTFALQADYDRFLHGQANRPQPPKKQEEKHEPVPQKNVYSVERDLLSVCFHFSELGMEIAKLLDEAWIDTTLPEGKLLNHTLNEFLHDMWNGPESLNDSLDDDELKRLAASIHFEELNDDTPSRIANEALRKLVNKYADRNIKEIRLEIARKQANFDDELLLLLEKITSLQKVKSNPPQIELS